MICPRGAVIDGGYVYPRSHQEVNKLMVGERCNGKKKHPENGYGSTVK